MTGGRVLLRLEMEPGLQESLPEDFRVVVRMKGNQVTIPLDDALVGRALFEFRGAETIDVQYFIVPRSKSPIAEGGFRLLQIVEGGSVTASRRPWVQTVRHPQFSAASVPSCRVTAASSSVCGIDVAVSPFYSPSPFFGSTFQSGPGTGASSPITITFSPSVRAVRVEIYDPSFAGNTATAYDSLGAEIAEVHFSYSGQPGVNEPDTLDLLPSGRISSVVLTPAVADYVAYSVSFDPADCPPTGDPMLDTPEVRAGFRDAMDMSNPDATPGTGQRKEIGGYIIQRPDGTFYTKEYPDPGATECTYLPPPTPPPGLPPGDFPTARYHTHPQNTGEDTYGCNGTTPSGQGWAQVLGDGLQVPPADPHDPDAGGGSNADWLSTLDGSPTWVYTKNGRAYKLDEAWVSNRSQNPNRWESDPMAIGCFTLLP
jgi:hypothetical protein